MGVATSGCAGAVYPYGYLSARLAPNGESGGEGPIAVGAQERYLADMNLVLLFIILLLLFGGGGFYIGGPAIGGGGLGLILLICLIVFLAGGFRKET